tara:strand:+ start:427 stop:1587 length:1161 start_codon:yes stop_codon:yes gene_type:complete
MALSKIDVANMLTGATPVANGGTALTSGFVNGKDPRKNAQPLIINGNMAVSQRGTSFSPSGAGTILTTDRFAYISGGTGDATITQESDAPASTNLRKSLKISPDATETLSGGENIVFDTRLEGQDVQVLGHGTSSPPKATLSFWVKSSKTGTYCVQIKEEGVSNESYLLYEYSISSANTWEQKIFSWTGNTAHTLNDDNVMGFRVVWHLAVGSDDHVSATTSWTQSTAFKATSNQVNFFDSTSNNWYLTGVQLEVGEFTSATIPPFQHESFNENLDRCQRYYFRNNAVDNIPFAAGVCNGTTNARAVLYFPQTMRAAPSLDKSGAGHFKVQIGSSVHDTTNTAFYYPNNDQALLYVDVSSGLTDGKGCLVIDDGGGSRYLEGSAEL